MEVEKINLEELVCRVRVAADKMGKRNPNRVLLFNVAAALEEIGDRLEEAWSQKPAKMLYLPGRGLHSVN
jgi:hypothetical protein